MVKNHNWKTRELNYQGQHQLVSGMGQRAHNPSRILQVWQTNHSATLPLLNLLTGCCGRTQSGEDTDSLIPSSGICHNFICKNQAQWATLVASAIVERFPL